MMRSLGRLKMLTFGTVLPKWWRPFSRSKCLLKLENALLLFTCGVVLLINVRRRNNVQVMRRKFYFPLHQVMKLLYYATILLALCSFPYGFIWQLRCLVSIFIILRSLFHTLCSPEIKMYFIHNLTGFRRSRSSQEETWDVYREHRTTWFTSSGISYIFALLVWLLILLVLFLLISFAYSFISVVLSRCMKY